jgi:hypothetical protein
MVSQIQTQNQNQSFKNIFSLLSEKEKKEFLKLISDADKYRNQYIKTMEKILELFKEIELHYSDLYDETGEYSEELETVIRIVDNLESLIYTIPLPADIVMKAIEERK